VIAFSITSATASGGAAKTGHRAAFVGFADLFFEYYVEGCVGRVFWHRDAADGGVAEAGFDWAGLDDYYVDAETFHLESQRVAE